MRYLISLVFIFYSTHSYALIFYQTTTSSTVGYGESFEQAVADWCSQSGCTSYSYYSSTSSTRQRWLTPGTAYASIYVQQFDSACPAQLPYDDGTNCLSEQPNTCLSLANTTGSYYTTQGISSCINGCSTTGVDVCVGSAKIINGTLTTEYSCTATFGASPQSCTGDNSTYDTPQDESCSDTQTEGSFNGLLKCVNADGSIADTRPNVITNENKTTTYDTVDNGDGTSTQTTTTTTTNSDGTTTISTTTTIIDNSTGEVQSEETQTEEEEKQDVYSDNGCKTPVTCEGDVLECASVRQLHELNCKLDVDPSDITAASLGVDPSLLTEEEGTTIDIADEIDTSSFLSSGCPAPRTVQVLQGELTIDYTPFCDLAEIIAPLVLFTASVISLRTVGGAF